jgi:hypothetical protein
MVVRFEEDKTNATEASGNRSTQSNLEASDVRSEVSKQPNAPTRHSIQRTDGPSGSGTKGYPVTAHPDAIDNRGVAKKRIPRYGDSSGRGNHCNDINLGRFDDDDVDAPMNYSISHVESVSRSDG